MRVALGMVVLLGLGGLSGCRIPPELGGDALPTDFVSDVDYQKLVFEIDAVRDRNVGPGAYASLRAGLERLADEGGLNKPQGVDFEFDDIDEAPLGAADTVHTLEGLSAAHDAVIDLTAAAGAAVVHVFWVDGHYEGDNGDDDLVLGSAYRSNRILMMRDNIDRACGGDSSPLQKRACERTTSTVLLHEMGHLLGLVNDGAPMQRDHQDEEHGSHSSNPECVMYFDVESSSVSDVTAQRSAADGEGDAPFFDDDCLDDLRALAAGG